VKLAAYLLIRVHELTQIANVRYVFPGLNWRGDSKWLTQ